MRVLLLFFLILPSTKLYSRPVGFKSIPIKNVITRTVYYLKPIKPMDKKQEQKFIVMECETRKPKIRNKNNNNILKPINCVIFSHITFSLSQLEAKIKDLEKHDGYYMSLDIGLLVGIFFTKARNWIFKTNLGKIVGLFILLAEISNLSVQRKQTVTYAVLSYMDRANIYLKNLNADLADLAKSTDLADLDKSTDLADLDKSADKKFWIKLDAMNPIFLNQFLNLFGDI